MEHAEYVRIVPGATTAVLFIHGIVGTPRHFQELIPLVDLVPREWSVYNILLDGHGRTVREFSRTSMEKWHSQVHDVFQMLSRSHKEVILVGHSMGTLFAVELAVARPDVVSELFLLAVPLCPGLRVDGMWRILKMVFGFTNENDPVESATKKVCGVTTTTKLWRYLPWIPRFLELFCEIYRVRRLLPSLNIRSVAFQSRKDELVRNRTERVLRKYSAIETIVLENSTHFYYAFEDAYVVLEHFRKSIEKHG